MGIFHGGHPQSIEILKEEDGDRSENSDDADEINSNDLAEKVNAISSRCEECDEHMKESESTCCRMSSGDNYVLITLVLLK